MDKRHRNECNTQGNVPKTYEKCSASADDCGQIDGMIGGFGKYQLLIFLFKILIGATSAFHNLGVTFFAPSDFISFWCQDTTSLPASVTTLPSINGSTIADSNPIINYNNNNNNNNYDKGTTYAQISHAESYVHNQTIEFTAVKDDSLSNSIRQLLGEFLFSTERKYKHSLNLNSDTPKNLRQECRYMSPVSNQYQKCTAYEYDTGIWISTIIDEWDLVCDRAWFISVTQSLYMGGFIMSYLMFGYISDRFGRWNSLFLGALIEISSGFGCAFASSVTQFMVFRFLLGLGNAGRSSSSYLIMIEWTGIRWRMHISALGSLGWVCGYCTMPWIALFFLHFRHMQLFVCFYEMVFLVWLLRLPESPRWLLTHKRFNEAHDVLLKAAKFNGLILDKETDDVDRLKEKKFIKTSSTGNLVLDDSSASSQHSESPTSLEGDNTAQRQPPYAPSHQQTPAERVESYCGIEKSSSEIKQRKNSIVGPIVGEEKSINSKTPVESGSVNFFAKISNLCPKWVCDEAKFQELLPYTINDFNLKFERLKSAFEAKEFTKNEDKLNILDLFRWQNLRTYTLILAFAWAANSFIYYGIALRVGDHGTKNLFMAFTFAGATEIPSLFFSMVCMRVLPRKTTNLFIFTAILLLCILQLPLRYYDCQWLQQLTMLLAKLFNTCAFTCILYQTMELFPTSIRQTAYSLSSLSGRIGSIMAPFVKELAQLTDAIVPPIIYAILSVLEIVLIRHLPETQGTELPDTLLEAEKFKGTDKTSKESKFEIAEKGQIEKLK